jgi:hypothetical protein
MEYLDGRFKKGEDAQVKAGFQKSYKILRTLNDGGEWNLLILREFESPGGRWHKVRARGNPQVGQSAPFQIRESSRTGGGPEPLSARRRDGADSAERDREGLALRFTVRRSKEGRRTIAAVAPTLLEYFARPTGFVDGQTVHLPVPRQ